MFLSQRSNVGERLPLSVAGLLRRISSELSCPICLGVLSDPLLTPCQHAFCKECIERALRQSGGERKAASATKCPVCKGKVSRRGLVGAERLNVLVNAFNGMSECYLACYGRSYEDGEDAADDGICDYKIRSAGNDVSAAHDEEHTNGDHSSLKQLLLEREKYLDKVAHFGVLEDNPLPSSPDPFLFQSLPHSGASLRRGNTCTDNSPRSKRRKKTSLEFATTSYKRITCSFLRREQEKIIDFAERYNFALTDQVSTDCLLFMPENGRIVKRSFKYMLAILLGSPIVSYSLIEHSLCNGRLIGDFKEYLVVGDEFEGDEIVMRSMKSHAMNEPGLFHDIKFYFYGVFERPSLAELQQLIAAGGGQVIEQVSKIVKGTLILCDPSITGTFEKDAGVVAKHRPIISIMWMMDSISSYNLLDRHPYIVL